MTRQRDSMLAASATPRARRSALAQPLPKTHLRVVGSISSLPQYKDYEVPFWTKQLAEKSGGAVTAEIKGFNEMGLKGPEVLRLMGQGVMEIGATVIAYLAADDPGQRDARHGGLLPDIATARKVTDAPAPVYEKLYREKFGVELLGFGTYPAQVLYCNGEIKGLADLKGKKVRVAGRPQSELITALGGTPVTLAVRRGGAGAAEQDGRLRHHRHALGQPGQVGRGHHAPLTLPCRGGRSSTPSTPRRWQRFDPRVRTFLEGEIKALKKPCGTLADNLRSRATTATPAPTRASSAPRAR